MALLHFFKNNGFKPIAAHCNFNLRGKESNEDANFIKGYCLKNDILYEEVVFDTSNIAKEKGLSIQETARELRYTWLEKKRIEKKATVVATAHHLDDNIETVIFKLIKGTGIKGIRGMQAKNGNIIRPFLQISTNEILAYLVENKIEYREDSSNSSTKYDRNKIRHNFLPLLEGINFGYHKTFVNHFVRWNDIEKFYESAIEYWKGKLVKVKNNDIVISIKALKKVNGFETLLFEILSQYGFGASDVYDLIDSFESNEPKTFINDNYRILLDKKFMYLTEVCLLNHSEIHYISEKQNKLIFENGILRFVLKPISKLSKINKGKEYAYIDAAKLSFPLTLRKWKQGDYFYPFGFTKQNGKPAKKKVSKFLKDEKVDARIKEQTWVLLSEGKLVWLANHRIDDRFALTAKTENVYQIKFIEK